MKAGVKVNPKENLPQGQTRDAVGERAKVSGKTVDKVKAVLASNPTSASLLRGMLYNAQKKIITNPGGLGGKSGKIDEGNSYPQQSTAEKLSEQTGVSPRTIKNDGKFAAAVEALKPAIDSV